MEVENPAPRPPTEPGAELQAAAAEEERESRELERAARAPAPVVVFTAATGDEAEIVRGLIESEGIPAIFDSSPAPIMGDVFSSGGGHWGEVLVAPADAERARALIAAYQSGPPVDESQIQADEIAGQATTEE